MNAAALSSCAAGRARTLGQLGGAQRAFMRICWPARAALIPTKRAERLVTEAELWRVDGEKL